MGNGQDDAHQVTYLCQRCNHVAQNLLALQKHLENPWCHGDSDGYTCQTCLISFRYCGDLLTHLYEMGTHMRMGKDLTHTVRRTGMTTEPLASEQTPGVSGTSPLSAASRPPSVSSLSEPFADDQETLGASSNDHRCHWCNLTFPTAREIDEHLWKHHVTCDLCKTVQKQFYLNERTLHHHHRIKHPNQPFKHTMKPQKESAHHAYSCGGCARTFLESKDLLQHLSCSRFHPNLECDDCHSIFPSLAALHDHLVLNNHMRRPGRTNSDTVYLRESAPTPTSPSPGKSPEFEILEGYVPSRTVEGRRTDDASGSVNRRAVLPDDYAMDVDVIDLAQEDECPVGSDVEEKGNSDAESSAGEEKVESEASFEILPAYPAKRRKLRAKSSRANVLAGVAKTAREDRGTDASLVGKHISRNQQETTHSAGSTEPQHFTAQSPSGNTHMDTIERPGEGGEAAGIGSRGSAEGEIHAFAKLQHTHLCVPCNQAFSMTRDVLKHISSAHSDRQCVYCDACAVLFFSIKAFNDHLVTHGQHTVTLDESFLATSTGTTSIFFYCAVCQDVRGCVDELVEHRRSRHGKGVVEQIAEPTRYSTRATRFMEQPENQ